jgi:hypothetical protein
MKLVVGGKVFSLNRSETLRVSIGQKDETIDRIATRSVANGK